MSKYYKNVMDPALQVVRSDIFELKKILGEISEKLNQDKQIHQAQWVAFTQNSDSFPERNTHIILAKRNLNTDEITYEYRYYDGGLSVDAIKLLQQDCTYCAWMPIIEYREAKPI
jgi:hypothetical protein